ncbi:MAG: trypsin-like peptidase domain-containing protein [Candidatus Acidiferrales bacterium]
MQARRRPYFRLSVVALMFLAFAPILRCETFTIISTPSGATVEIDGVVVGTTPYTAKFPRGYFHKPHVVFASRLEHPIVIRVYKDGFTSQEVTVTEGPHEWVALNGKNYGRYWLLKGKEAQFALKPVSAVFNGSVRTTSASGATIDLTPEMPIENVVQTASPAVVLLRRHQVTGAGLLTISGTGFLVTSTGVVATNEHVTKGAPTISVVLPQGTELLGRVVYSDPKMDLALVKVEGEGFPYLPLGNITGVHAGQTVIAIGNPGGGAINSVTKGIVSAAGSNRIAGEGTWIQTDAAINPGNSGGPLLDTHARVLGITTSKPIGSDGTVLQGVAFALSSEDLLQVLRRFYPATTPDSPPRPAQPAGAGTVTISSAGATLEIYVDGKFVGQSPSVFSLPTGPHKIVIKASGSKDWERDLDVLRDSQVALHPVLEPQP